MTSLQPYKDAILALVDRDSWKHSWYFLRNFAGQIDWPHPSLHQQIEGLIQEAEEEQRNRQELIDKAKTALEILIATYRSPETPTSPKFTLSIAGVPQQFVWISSGSFSMGSPSGEPDRWDNEAQHSVTLTKGYWLADTACTQELWQAVMGENPAHFSDDPQNPVEQVSWNDCQIFIQAANERLGGGLELRLPSEAEWEYACRASSQGPFSWGDTLSTCQANYDGGYPYNDGPKGEYRKRTLPVRFFKPNPWSLFQMHGNVYEWCEDRLGNYPEGSVVDPAGPVQGPQRVLRGGGWLNSGGNLRSAYRSGFSPDDRYRDIGLRLAITNNPEDLQND